MSAKPVVRFALAAALLGIAFAAPTTAQAAVEAGSLSCRTIGGTSFVVGSVREFSCLFHPAAGGPPHPYVATIRRVGVDIGFTQGAGLGWIVFAPTRFIGPGDIAGGYGGVSAGAAVGVGVGANVLFGGLNNAFALQPVSFEGQSGLNAAGGFAGLDLRAVAPVRPVRHVRRARRR